MHLVAVAVLSRMLYIFVCMADHVFVERLLGGRWRDIALSIVAFDVIIAWRTVALSEFATLYFARPLLPLNVRISSWR